MTRERSKEQIPIRKPKSRKVRQATNAPFSLQRWLFDLFRILDIDQKTIAAHLGVSKTMVSFWANGRELISRYYLEMLHELAFTTLVENNKQKLLTHERLFDYDSETLREKVNLERQLNFYEERDRQLQDMNLALSNVASALCEKVAGEYREVTNFIEPRPERPLHKMLRISRETRASLKNGCHSILSDLEQLDDLLWFEEIFIGGSEEIFILAPGVIFIREPTEASTEQSPEDMRAQVMLNKE